MAIAHPNLTQRPPRSGRVRLGGFVILPRMLDKGRAALSGKAGEYHFNCPMDQHFLGFVGIDAAKLKKELARGKGDGEMLDWIMAHAKHKRSAVEIAAWSAYHDARVPTDMDSRKFFSQIQHAAAPKREDVGTWFELLDIDDFVSFGGKA